MPHALIVAHGQPSDPEPAESALAAYAAEVDALSHDVSVHAATLAAPGSLEGKLDTLPDDTVIFPLFMAKGWFVTSALPKRLGDRAMRILDPLGTQSKLPDLVAAALQDRLEANTWQVEQTDLVLAAHGSGRSRNPSAVARDFADRVAKIMPFRSVRVGFVEEPPSICDAAADVGDQAICLPFFACTGGHVLDDIPEELARAAFTGEVLPVVGELPRIKQHIAARLRAELAGSE